MKTLARRNTDSLSRDYNPWLGLPSLFQGFGLDNWFGKQVQMPKLEEKDGKITAQFAVPGLTKNDLKVDYNDGYIEVTGKKNSDKQVAQLYMSEYVGDVDTKTAKAEVKDGLLTIHCDRTESQHRVPIQLEG